MDFIPELRLSELKNFLFEDTENVKYYDPKEGALASTFSWRYTIFELVMKRPEFYCYIFWNYSMITLCILLYDPDDVNSFHWDSAQLLQYVMVFFLTFYNTKCFDRYELLYPACQEFMDGVAFFVQEMNVSLHWPDLLYHRIAATKYLLAAVHEYFMTVCGGKLTDVQWAELHSKGLLTTREIEILRMFPGGGVTFVLTSWVLFVVKDALVQDCMWRKACVCGAIYNNQGNLNANPYGEREERFCKVCKRSLKDDVQGRDVSQQTVHIYNRHCEHVVYLQRACHKIGYTMANPIPFSYFHLMNLILMANVFLLATFSGLFRSFFAVILFAMAMFVYMGLREISTCMADPFGEDSIDFPMADFMRSCFDRVVSLLLAFTMPDVRERCFSQIENGQEFKDINLKHPMKMVFFSENDDPAKGNAVQLKWSRKSCFETAKEDRNLVKWFKIALIRADVKEADLVAADRKNPWVAKYEALVARRESATTNSARLAQEVSILQERYNKVLADVEKIDNTYPELVQMGTATVPAPHYSLTKSESSAKYPPNYSDETSQ